MKKAEQATQTITAGRETWQAERTGMPGKPWTLRSGNRILTLVKSDLAGPNDPMPAVDFRNLDNNPTGLRFREVDGALVKA